MQLTKGANLALPPTRTVTVTCTWLPCPGLDADLSALLLVDGRVRGDADFVFYNQPASADRRVVHAGRQAGTGRVDVELAGFDEVVGTVAFAVSLDGAPGRSLAELGPIRASIDGGGEPLTFVVDGLTDETAAVALELYRRGAHWKVRAVGQGYRDGLAGLARDFGVDVVDDEPAAPPGIDWRHPPVPAGYELAGFER